MAHENDSFIREVNEEIRSEQFRSAWRQFGPIIIGAAAVIVLATAGWRGYEYWRTTAASASGDKFIAAVTLADQGKTTEALAALKALETDGHGAYPVLARMRAATVQAQGGDAKAAITAFAAIGSDTSVPEVVRDVAKLRAGWLLIDNGSYSEVSTQVEALATPRSAMRHSAREALGLSAYKAGDMVKARDWFSQITADPETPRNVSSRAQILLDTIAASGKAS